MQSFKTFSAVTVPLSDTNLIEASAGTGKTYSIAVMVLRLLLEQDINIRQVLMVTFTKAAVAELEERIRLFVKEAHKASLGQSITDATITQLVQQAMLNQSDVPQKLQAALIFLDELSVLTIHSFCQQTLTEFAFETRQLFGAETMNNTRAVIEEEINQYWRTHITTLPPGLLEMLLKSNLSRMGLYQVISEHLNGKKYFAYQAGRDYNICDTDKQQLLNELNAAKAGETNLRQKLEAYITDHADRLRQLAGTNTYARNANMHQFVNAADFAAFVDGKKNQKYIQKLFADVVLQCNDCAAAKQLVDEQIDRAIRDINCHAITVVEAGLQLYKQRNNLLSFDDMIVNLHKALVQQPAESLVLGLRRKYKAVFVDEFQDTDKLQYEIFQKAFGADTILFLIGDPKQSIYAWRKADVFTYFKARTDVQHLYSMNQNFRSSQPLIEAMNQFFLPQPGFDTFNFQQNTDVITYHPVESPNPNTKGELLRNGHLVTPITITEVDGKPQVAAALAAHIAQLLSDPGYKIRKNNADTAITPSDIGVLVRSNSDAHKVKEALTRYCIPAVTINDSKVLKSGEAVFVLYLLQAIAETSKASINKALLSPFTGYGADEILALNSDTTLALFRKYRSRWYNDGVYTALTDFVTDFNVRAYLLHPQTVNGERIIANLYQLIELIHKAQVSRQLSPLELMSWLKRGTEGMDIEGDEFEQRIESDDDSVKIVTIHKSKGLEYKIVFAPYLDFVEHRQIEQYTYRNPVTGEYLSIEKKHTTTEQLELVRLQNEQENRRLVYVAITRAVYRCYIYRCSNNYYNTSTLSVFVNALRSSSPGIAFTDLPVLPAGFRYRTDEGYKPAGDKPIEFNLLHNSWKKLSYTLLAAKHDAVSRPRSPQQQAYDQFVYNQLPRGSKTGNLLHYILENIQFNNSQAWSYVISEALRQFYPMQAETFAPLLLQMLHEILTASVTVNHATFTLSNISRRINEFEFDFPVASFNPYTLTGLANTSSDVRIAYNEAVEGIMNGKMDLFFEYENRFYILDWKSNYLGDQPQDYSMAALVTAMNENNYHLQYLIYTLAAKKYLESRLPQFDYEQQFGGVVYCFVRGMRSGQAAGVYTNRVSLQQLNRLNELLTVEV